MRLEKASFKAVQYACLKFHYAKAVPQVGVAYSVFQGDEWVGVIVFSYGANLNIGKPYNLQNGQCIELVRVALNGKQTATSQAVAKALKKLRRDAPLVKLVVSYADKGQGHLGIIYQATNWAFVEETASSGLEVLAGGRWMHKRSWDGLKQKPRIEQTRRKPGKYKYLYPLHKSMVKLCKDLAKQYPKPEADGTSGTQ